MKCLLGLAAVLTLLIFAAPASALNCGDTVTGDTGDVITLGSDLTCPPGTDAALYVQGGGFTLSLGQHTIRGANFGVKTRPGLPVSGVTIRSGRIEPRGDGVNVFGSNNVVTGLTIGSNGGGIFLKGDGNQVIKNQITVVREPSNEVPGATRGIQVEGTNAYITRNTVRDAYFGINSQGNNPRVVVNTIFGCDRSAPGAQGIRVVDYVRDAMIAQNTVRPCGSSVSSESAGIYATPRLNEAGGARVQKNTVAPNPADEPIFVYGWLYGIQVSDPAARVAGNLARYNGDGISSERAGATLTGNEAYFNECGICAAPGTIDGGGNRATDNGTDCVNVAC